MNDKQKTETILEFKKKIKYIVKNCPAIKPMITVDGKHGGKTMFDVCSEGKYIPCKDRTDCPIKQVVELVKQYNEAYETIQLPTPTLNKQILQTLQVEEVK